MIDFLLKTRHAFRSFRYFNRPLGTRDALRSAARAFIKPELVPGTQDERNRDHLMRQIRRDAINDVLRRAWDLRWMINYTLYPEETRQALADLEQSDLVQHLFHVIAAFDELREVYKRVDGTSDEKATLIILKRQIEGLQELTEEVDPFRLRLSD
jgi:hypothetical protein